VNLLFVFRADDQEHTKPVAIRPRQRPGQKYEAFLGERTHERCVIGHLRLRSDPSLAPGGSGISDDREIRHLGHARAIK
jgi:hypothetical protein